ncbi:hypothetical protein NESM_000458700 [Novymonas esmeraldas]|uniref:Uncharacterized protein n=1 Tax=Novymonas esmeraldas TaxID=1808958 RepID=A0AAW0EMH8_9TRYP
MRNFFRTSNANFVSGHSDHHNSQHQHDHSHQSHTASPQNNSARTAPQAGNRPNEYPVALPSALEKKFTGPVEGTAVLDDRTMPLDEAAAIFEMVTPENTPLLKTHVKERFEAAAEEEMEQHRHEQEHAESSNTSSSENVMGTSAPTAPRTNTFDYFPTPDVSFASFHSTKTHHRRKVLADGGYVIFSDAYLSAHPMSCITGVTNELHMAALNNATGPHPPCTGPDAEKRRLQEVKDYIKEVEHEYRPLFRRRRSGAVYGHAQYFQPGDIVDSGSHFDPVFYATPMAATAKAEPAHPPKKLWGLRRILSSPFL